MENKIPDIIAHPDLYTINRKEFGDIEKTVAHIICSIAEENSIPIEINLSEPILYLVGKINKITSPHKEFWKIATEYKKLKVVYGIDAHYQNQIELYENALELVKEHIGHEIIDELNFCNDNLEID